MMDTNHPDRQISRCLQIGGNKITRSEAMRAGHRIFSTDYSNVMQFANRSKLLKPMHSKPECNTRHS